MEATLLVNNRDFLASDGRIVVRFGGRAAISEFTALRWITIETEPHRCPF